ncbi:bifunctional glycosyltransferase family 2 protein/CDP-glycerol:glycerophosphate glycerophosphotransferase [Sporolactobacillus sp. THM19-2]|uniref:bifunctional glycosyltransferase/CDP-glycerol:glycerophosphate glycerophosphotransferase n=1 Tax=Sporolactobacillus sp. THM19-2 TaxID=2511171 RepID=UPI0010200916|nr:bifunctional glycosyltransferase family 2 protein/CDP-glycerol:glycerophosphate glycerophosphotransferase [Sporolactobacillus sp. THM19-2]RYL90298.1 CDP-glycerol:glycerophosphate glycerophosphotransferase [Sporolactobacillus sp. THM19-2]
MDYNVSVIVPGYNVAQFIRQCLDSLVHQSIKVQVIMVDDGSTDNETGKIMDEYASRYDDFIVIHQNNRGLGAARNVGVKHADGKYIAFLDSDDYVSLNAYEILYGMAERTGSDIVIGGVNRFNSKKNVKSWLHSKAVSDTIEKTHITENFALLYDTTAWNKLYKRSFWLQYKLSFPERMLYEDIPVTIPAHFLAKSVSVVEQTVYYWRIRETNDGSITQNRSDITNFKDRLKALHMLDEFLKHNATQKLIEANQFKLLTVDYSIYLKDLKYADSNYINQFQSMLSKELTKINKSLFRKLPAQLALSYKQVLANNMDDVLKLSKMNRKQDLNIKPYRKGKKWYKRYSLSETLNDQPVCIDESLEPVAKIHKVRWNENNELEITGHAYIECLDSKRSIHVSMSAEIVNLSNNRSVKLPVTLSKDRSITRKWGVSKVRKINPLRRVYNYNWSHFNIKCDTENTLNLLNSGRWAVMLTINVKGVTRTIRLGSPLKGSNEVKFKLFRDFTWDVKYNGRWDLAIDVTRPKTIITECSVNNNELVIAGKSEDKVEGFTFKTFDPVNKQFNYFSPALFFNNSHQFSITIPAHQIELMSEQNSDWLLEYNRSGESIAYPVTACLEKTHHIFNMRSHNVWVENKSGKIYLYSSKYMHPVLKDISLSENKMKIKIDIPARTISEKINIKKRRLVFESEKNGPSFFMDLSDDDRNLIDISINLFDDSGHFKMYTSGRWNIFLEIFGVNIEQKQIAEQIPVIIDESMTDSLNFTFTYHNLLFRALKGRHMSLYFRTSIKWDRIDRTSRRRKFVKWYLYPLMRLLPIKKNVIVFESLWGRSFSDNPKAIYEYISRVFGNKYKCIWILNNEYTPITGPGVTVRRNSWLYFYYLSRGKYFVENTNLPNFYVKRYGQIEMQTLHGTFLKTMGLDEKVTFNTKKKQESLLKRSGRWDLLITPSPYMTKTATNAFCFKHQVIESGFPRNDALYQKNSPDSIRKIKEKLNLPHEKKIILYAPTFRNKGQFNIQLNFDLLQQKLSDHYIILLRLHYFIARRINVEKYRDFIYDVSSYPDINDLYLISDMMITDYSSVMFDYAHLKRPMIFYAYDLDYYRNDLRGIYLNYEETVPGPIVKNTEGIIKHILDPDALEAYKSKYSTFYEKFCTFGRGDSSRIAAEKLLYSDIKLQRGEPYIREKIKNRIKSFYPKIFRKVGQLPAKNNLILFESFFGKQYSDNPRAIYEYMKKNYPEYRLIWNVKKGYEETFKKHNVPYVIKYSFKGIWSWARARYWITNSRWPLWLPKPKHTIYIQTWHGTPLKTLGADIQHITMPGMTLAKYHSQFTSEARKWDYCIAPNEYSSKIFKRAFEVQGQMINSGYPRNDLLYQKNDQYMINQIKKKLHIPLEKKVILYAPTWRDNEYKMIDHYTFDLKLDLDLMRKSFGENAVILMRLHYLISENLDLSGYENFAFDMSGYEDIRELYLVSDILITDYSSVFFDYANLKRPIVFYAYDLDDYANTIRGFYFNFRKEAPGPIVEDMKHLIPAVRDALTYNGDNPYPEFYNKFCSWEDGHASERVVKTFLQGKNKN